MPDKHLVPVDMGDGRQMVVGTEESIIRNRLATLPDESEFQKWIGLVVVDAAKQIVLGQLPFKSAGEASKVARDFVAIAKDLNWTDEANALKAAETPADRMEALEALRARAQTNMLGLRDDGAD